MLLQWYLITICVELEKKKKKKKERIHQNRNGAIYITERVLEMRNWEARSHAQCHHHRSQ